MLGDSALPIVEAIFAPDPGEAARANAATGESEVSAPPCKKRRDRTDENHCAMMDCVAQWVSSRVKRLCSSESWCSARPAALAAMLRVWANSDRGSDGGGNSTPTLGVSQQNRFLAKYVVRVYFANRFRVRVSLRFGN